MFKMHAPLSNRKNPPISGESSYNLKDYVRFSLLFNLTFIHNPNSYRPHQEICICKHARGARGTLGLDNQPWMEPLTSQANNGLVAQ